MRNLALECVRSRDDATLVANLIQQWRPELQRLCLRWAGGHLADADDLLAEACLRAIQATLRDGAPVDNPMGWLTTIVRNLGRDRLRAPERRRRVDELPEDSPCMSPETFVSVESSLGMKELLTRAARELRCLPAAQRRSLLARASGEDYPAIARALGTSPANARKLVQAARCTLRARLRTDGLASFQAT